MDEKMDEIIKKIMEIVEHSRQCAWCVKDSLECSKENQEKAESQECPDFVNGLFFLMKGK